MWVSPSGLASVVGSRANLSSLIPAWMVMAPGWSGVDAVRDAPRRRARRGLLERAPEIGVEEAAVIVELRPRHTARLARAGRCGRRSCSALRSSACAHTPPNMLELAPITAVGLPRKGLVAAGARDPVERVLELAPSRVGGAPRTFLPPRPPQLRPDCVSAKVPWSNLRVDRAGAQPNRHRRGRSVWCCSRWGSCASWGALRIMRPRMNFCAKPAIGGQPRGAWRARPRVARAS